MEGGPESLGGMEVYLSYLAKERYTGKECFATDGARGWFNLLSVLQAWVESEQRDMCSMDAL